MTRWIQPPELEPRARSSFDPLLEGAKLGLSRERALALWQRACAETARGGPRADDAEQRFRALAAQLDARGPEVGRRTRAETEDALGSPDERVADEPGRTSLVATEARRWPLADVPPRGDAPHPRAAAPPPSSALPTRAPHPLDGPRRTIDTRAPATIMRLAAGPAQHGASQQARAAASSSGQPLDPATRAWAESALGYDFGDVTVHTGGEAAKAARGIGARAYTFGRSIVFGQGQYDPASPDGRKLLAHELTHVVQQSRTSHGDAAPPAASRATACLHRVMAQLAAIETDRSRAPHNNASPPGVAGHSVAQVTRALAMLADSGDERAKRVLLAILEHQLPASLWADDHDASDEPDPDVSAPSDPAELEAEHVADAVMRGDAVAIHAHAHAHRAHRAPGGSADPFGDLTMLLGALGAVVVALLLAWLANRDNSTTQRNATTRAGNRGGTRGRTTARGGRGRGRGGRGGRSSRARGAPGDNITPLNYRAALFDMRSAINDMLAQARDVDATAVNRADYQAIVLQLNGVQAWATELTQVGSLGAWNNRAHADDFIQNIDVEADALHAQLTTDLIAARHPQLTNARARLTTLVPLSPHLDAAARNQLDNTITSLDDLLADEAALDIDSLPDYLAGVAAALGQTNVLMARYHTAHVANTVAALQAAAAVFPPNIVGGVIAAAVAVPGGNIHAAELALNFVRAAGRQAPTAALFPGFRASVILEAHAQAASAAELTALAHFQRQPIPAAEIITIPDDPNDSLLVGQRAARLSWKHILNAHHYTYATPEVLQARIHATSFWPAATTRQDVSNYIQQAANQHPQVAVMRAAIRANGNAAFVGAPLVVAGFNVQLGMEVRNGRLRIGQFYPNGGGVVTFTAPRTNALGHMLAHR